MGKLRPFSRAYGLASFLLLFGSFSYLELPAAERHWTGGATPGPDGFYETPGNWSAPFLPSFDDVAYFGIGATYQVTLNSSPTVSGVGITAGDITFAAGSTTLRTLSTQQGWAQSQATVALNKVQLQIGTALSLQGSSVLRLAGGGGLTASNGLTIGETVAGTAMLEVEGEGNNTKITVDGVTRIGHAAAGSGTLRLTGPVEGDFSTVINVGAAGSGVFEILNGATIDLDGTLLVASQFGPTGTGKLVIDGAGSTLDVIGAGEVAVGVIGRAAEVAVTNGGYFSTGTSLTQIAAGSKLIVDAGEMLAEGLLDVQGTTNIRHGGLLTAATTAKLDGPVTIESGGVVMASTLDVAPLAGSVSSIVVQGDGSQLHSSGTMRVIRSGTLAVTQGAHLSASTLAVATDLSAIVNVNIVNASVEVQRLVLGGSLSGVTPLAGGTAVASVGFGGTLQLNQSLHILGTSQLKLDGGELRAPSFATLGDARFKFEAGTFTVMGSATIDSAVVASLPSGTLDFGRGLTVEGTATMGAPLTLNGGKLSAATLVGGSLLQFQSGTLAITGEAGLTLGAGGPIGSSLTLDIGSELKVTHSLTVAPSGHLVVGGGRVEAGNLLVQGQLELFGPASEIVSSSLHNQGLIAGEGRLTGGPVVNSSTGVIAVAEARQLRLGATGHLNEGRIELAGGRLEVDGQLTNAAGGDIVGRGTLSFGISLNNQGDLVLAGGTTDLFGDVVNQGPGRVLVSGGSDVVFWDDVSHTGAAFNVSNGSTVTFFGQAGFSVTGGGAVFFEDDITPGNSPGLASFGGDVYFGGGANLMIELAGTSPGTQYDRVVVDDTAFLGGALTVSLIDGFVPQVGSEFTILTASDLDDTFDSVHLPNLGGQLAFQMFYDSDAVRLKVVPSNPGEFLAGDYNNDGIVDAADYTVWRNSVGTIAVLHNDSLGGTIGAAHYLQWKQNFGSQLGAAVSTATAVPVPEPATVFALGLCFLAFGVAAGHRSGGVRLARL